MSWKEVNDKRLATVHPILAQRVRSLIDHMEEQGVHVIVTQALRTVEEQDKLYAQGRGAPGKKVTNAPGGHSQHNFGLAVDVCPLTAALQPDWDVEHADWKAILAAAPQFQLAEGAMWKCFHDTPHLYPMEIPAECAVLREHYAAGGMENVNRWFESLVKTNGC